MDTFFIFDSTGCEVVAVGVGKATSGVSHVAVDVLIGFKGGCCFSSRKMPNPRYTR